MKLSTRGRYGIHAMYDLAQYAGDIPQPIKSIAERQNIPEAYLEQLIGQLRRNDHTYTGEFENSKIKGFGRMTFDNGDVYEGKFFYGRLTDGVFIGADGKLKYEGQFGEKYQYSGYGILYDDDGMIGAKFSNGGISPSEGWLKTDDSIFRGAIRANGKKLIGVQEFANGARVEGDVNGYAKLIDKDYVALGEIKNQKLCGYCIVIKNDGVKIRCRFENGKIVERF